MKITSSIPSNDGRHNLFGGYYAKTCGNRGGDWLIYRRLSIKPAPL